MFNTNKQLAHMEIAMGELGQTEVPGAADNPRIVEYFDAVTYRATDDETPWCAAFANSVLMRAGIARTESAAALSFLKWGVKTTKPKYGDIVVFDHGGGRGHVGFYVTSDANTVSVLGGNQNNSVNVTKFRKENVAAYRTPKSGWDSKTVLATAAIMVTAGGQVAASAANSVAATAVTAAEQASAEPIVNVANMLLPMVPVEWQPVASAAITILSGFFIISERLKKIKQLQV